LAIRYCRRRDRRDHRDPHVGRIDVDESISCRRSGTNRADLDIASLASRFVV
jgi:hypothetical protein